MVSHKCVRKTCESSITVTGSETLAVRLSHIVFPAVRLSHIVFPAVRLSHIVFPTVRLSHIVFAAVGLSHIVFPAVGLSHIVFFQLLDCLTLFLQLLDCLTLFFQLLDCLTIPTVLTLSWIFLHVRYTWTHFLGVVVAVTGVGMLVLADYLVAKDKSQGECETGPMNK